MIQRVKVIGDIAYITVTHHDTEEDVIVDADKVDEIVNNYPNLKVNNFKSGTGKRTINKYACFYSEYGIVMLHRVLVKAPRGMLVTFRDKNSLNCTSDNLMLVTGSELSASSSKRSKSGHVGIRTYKDKFRAYIKIKKKQINLGLFDTLEEAIQARKDAEKKYWGYSVDYTNTMEDTNEK